MLELNHEKILKLSYHDYYNKVLGGWLGKSLGGVIGAPFENHKQYNHRTMDNIWPEALAPNDDLDIQVVWLEALQERGLYLSSADLTEFWQDRCWYNFCEYGIFLNNVQRGIAAPLSGTWNNDFFVESEGCPIRSEIWGFICPGNPQLAAEYAKLDGQLDHGGISVEIEQFLSAAAAQAFVTDDLAEILQAGLSVIPSASPAALAVAEVRQICDQYPDAYDAWRILIRRYGDRDASKAITNHVIVLMALFLGESNFKKTMTICVNSGWDTDCTAATAGALLGVMHGTKIMPEDWMKKLGDNLICNVEVKHKTAPIVDFAKETCFLGVEMTAEKNKGIEILAAPAVVVRKRPAPKISIGVEYPQEPVLWRQRSTPVKFVVNNPTSIKFSGKLHIEAPANIKCDTPMSTLEIKSGAQQSVELNFHRRNPEDWLPDKNLFKVSIISEESAAVANAVFGLAGARQWQIYGPYWDMWDKTKNEICPYQNEDICCNPSAIGYNDYYNHHIRPYHPYLNETELLEKDIPEELPLELEWGKDLITEKEFGGFNGQACYYLVRTIRSAGLIGLAKMVIGRSGPCQIWLDGKLIANYDNMRGWAPDESIDCTLTGKAQRLVVKFIRLTDTMSFSVSFAQSDNSPRKQGISYFLDCLEDLPNRMLPICSPGVNNLNMTNKAEITKKCTNRQVPVYNIKKDAEHKVPVI